MEGEEKKRILVRTLTATTRARSLTSAIECAKLGIFQWLKRGERKERNDDAGRLQKADQCPNVFALGCCTLVSRRSPAHIFFSNTATALLGASECRACV